MHFILGKEKGGGWRGGDNRGENGEGELRRECVGEIVGNWKEKREVCGGEEREEGEGKLYWQGY